MFVDKPIFCVICMEVQDAKRLTMGLCRECLSKVLAKEKEVNRLKRERERISD